MALFSDLLGLGFAPALANLIGFTINPAPGPGTPPPGIGTTQSGAQAISTTITYAAPTAGQTAFTLPTTAQGAQGTAEYYFFNGAATAVSALVYPPTGGATLNGSTSAAITIAQNKGCQFMLVDNVGGTAPTWVALLGS